MTESSVAKTEALSQLPILANMEEDRRMAVITGELTLAENRRRGYSDWLVIGQGLAELQEEVRLHSNSETPKGRRYAEAWGRLAPPNFKLLDGADRTAVVWLWQNREAVGQWYETLTQNQRDRWRHPVTIKTKFKMAGQRHEQGAEPEGEQAAQTRPTLRSENVRLQDELDTARARIAVLEGGQDHLTGGSDWTWQDEPEDIARAWLRVQPTKVKQIAAIMLRLSRSDAPQQTQTGRPRPAASRAAQLTRPE